MKTYGVVAGIREGVKLGWLYLTDIACLALVIGPSIFLDQLFPRYGEMLPKEKLSNSSSIKSSCPVFSIVQKIRR